MKLTFSGIYFTHFREFRKNSQTIDLKVFLNEALKTEALFHNETAQL
jgi:hypothetical protein